jgi:hypothetical protein
MLDTQGRQQVTYFIGTEVENTAMKGQKTLFIVGTPPVEDIINIAERNQLGHLYFGTSQSFNPKSDKELQEWVNVIIPLLRKGFWVTLDYDVSHVEKVLDCGFDEHNNFISMISVKLPYMKTLNYNATIKLDDTTWGHSNPGVWCHPLNELLTRDVYTDWKDYVGDTPVDIQ